MVSANATCLRIQTDALPVARKGTQRMPRLGAVPFWSSRFLSLRGGGWISYILVR